KGWIVNALALAYGVSAIANILWPRNPGQPWYANDAMIVTTIGVLALGLLYMVSARPYEHGTAPAGDAHRLSSQTP
ncbi:MAG: amino acid permease, partial [Gammaproteobacteria bacterium]|nr:amino acid permease [Gammaproteobacteria bacterium]